MGCQSQEVKREGNHLVGVGFYPGDGNVCELHRNGSCPSVSVLLQLSDSLYRRVLLLVSQLKVKIIFIPGNESASYLMLVLI